MKVYKFGGASVKDAAGVRNLEKIVSAADDELMVVVSAMGKTTNALERVVEFLDAGKEEAALNQWVDIIDYHVAIMKELGLKPGSDIRLQGEIPFDPQLPLDENYDQVVSLGEIMSTQIVAVYLLKQGLSVEWWNMPKLLRRIKTLVTGIDKIENGYIVETESMGKKQDFKCKILIAADGPEGHVARWAGLRPAAKAKEMESGVQYEMCNVEFEKPGVIEFYLGSCAPGGYVWIFPKGDDIANVGLAILPHKAEKTAKEYLDDFVANSPYLKNAQAVELNVGGDPVGGMTKKLYDDNIMVVGDAAGQVNPLTGGGIISGMTGGMCAGKVAAQAIKEDCSKKYLKLYDQMAHEELDHEIKRYKKVQEYLLTLSDSELDSIAHAFQGESFDKISTTEIVQKLIKISPKALLKLGKFI